jgi:hypothetical protein
MESKRPPNQNGDPSYRYHICLAVLRSGVRRHGQSVTMCYLFPRLGETAGHVVTVQVAWDSRWILRVVDEPSEASRGSNLAPPREEQSSSTDAEPVRCRLRWDCDSVDRPGLVSHHDAVALARSIHRDPAMIPLPRGRAAAFARWVIINSVFLVSCVVLRRLISRSDAHRDALRTERAHQGLPYTRSAAKSSEAGRAGTLWGPALAFELGTEVGYSR